MRRAAEGRYSPRNCINKAETGIMLLGEERKPRALEKKYDKAKEEINKESYKLKRIDLCSVNIHTLPMRPSSHGGAGYRGLSERTEH